MTGFAVYSTSIDPDCLYATGDTERVDAEATVDRVWSGDHPLELVVDLGGRRVWWTFRADRETTARRTGHFVAAYHGGADLFGGFAEALRDLDDADGWDLPQAGRIPDDVGFELWQMESIPADEVFESLLDRLATHDADEPLTVGMTTYRRAFQALQGLEQADSSATAAVDGDGAVPRRSAIDVVLVPGADQDFEMEVPGEPTASGGETSWTAGTPVGDSGPSPTPAGSDTPGTDGGAASRVSPPRTDGTASDARPDTQTGGSRIVNGFTVRIAGVVLVALLGFAVSSFVRRQPLQPISGLAVFGGCLGAAAAVALWYTTGRETVRLRRWLRSHTDRVVLALALGTFAGFAFPRVLWELGVLAGGDNFLFGSITAPRASVLATLAYVGCLLVVTLAGLGIAGAAGRLRRPTPRVLVRVTVGFAVYGVCLVLATGLSDALWSQFIPAA